MKPITPTQRFNFACHSTVSCFNQCCRDLNQFLTPYDVLRLKRRMGLTSYQFLESYTVRHHGPQSGFPVVTFKMNPADHMRCPCVHADGCSVYEDRPSSCRTYPLVRLASRSRETGKISENYFLIQEEHCLGFDEKQNQTAEEWVENQGIDVYNRMNDMLLELISLKNRLLPDPFDDRTMQLIYTAFYDIDRFRSRIASGEISVSTGNVDELDDVGLLKLSIQWVKGMMLELSSRPV
jgi:Fe-S-cluster containining protein